jgi:hypothetical protein
MKKFASGIAVIALALASTASPTDHPEDRTYTIAVNSPPGRTGLEFSVANPHNLTIQLDCWGRYAIYSALQQRYSSSHLTHHVCLPHTKLVVTLPETCAFYCRITSNNTANYFPVYENGQGAGLTVLPDGFYKDGAKISGYKSEGEDIKALFDSWLLNWGNPDGKEVLSTQKLAERLPIVKKVFKHRVHQTKIHDAAEKVADEAIKEAIEEGEEAKKAKEAEELAKKAEKSNGVTIGVSVALTIAVIVLSM